MNDIIEYAYKQLNNNAYGELILPIRKKIWEQFGNVDYDNIQKDVSDSIKRRVKLADKKADILLLDVEMGKMNCGMRRNNITWKCRKHRVERSKMEIYIQFTLCSELT